MTEVSGVRDLARAAHVHAAMGRRRGHCLNRFEGPCAHICLCAGREVIMLGVGGSGIQDVLGDVARGNQAGDLVQHVYESCCCWTTAGQTKEECVYVGGGFSQEVSRGARGGLSGEPNRELSGELRSVVGRVDDNGVTSERAISMDRLRPWYYTAGRAWTPADCRQPSIPSL